MRVTLADFRAAGVCMRVRDLFLAPNGLDISNLKTTGVDADQLLATGDARAPKIVGVARRREQLTAMGLDWRKVEAERAADFGGFIRCGVSEGVADRAVEMVEFLREHRMNWDSFVRRAARAMRDMEVARGRQ